MLEHKPDFRFASERNFALNDVDTVINCLEIGVKSAKIERDKIKKRLQQKYATNRELTAILRSAHYNKKVD